jgi:hypothetical protein
VVQARRRAALAQEAVHEVVVAAELRGQHLERHVAVQRRVVPAIDHAHAALAQLGDDPVGADLAARQAGATPGGGSFRAAAAGRNRFMVALVGHL